MPAVIIAEKPSVAADIAHTLNVKKKIETLLPTLFSILYIEGRIYFRQKISRKPENIVKLLRLCI